MNNKRAIWIFDDAFKELTYISVRSFATQCIWPVSLVYYGEELEKVQHFFADIPGTIEWIDYHPDVSIFPLYLQGTITNRLARFFICERYAEDLILLVDSDVAFSDLLTAHLDAFSENIMANHAEDLIIAGVVEYEHAINAYLFFNKKNERGDANKVPESKQKRLLRSVFGPKWNSLLKQPQFNNGLLFFNCALPLIRKWKEFYLRMLLYPDINPADDQVPLAVAIKSLNVPTIDLPSKWNSLGRTSGPFIAYHAWAGKWKNNLKDIHRNISDLTDYGAICRKQVAHWPKEQLDKIIKRLYAYPTYYTRIPGYFDFGGIYSDIVLNTTSGHFVEVGTYMGRSTCFMAELLKECEKTIQFDSIDHYCRKDTSLQSVQITLQKFGVAEYVHLKKGHSKDVVQEYQSSSLDFVFLDMEQNSDDFYNELELWYSKIKPAGILAGYDYSIHDTINQNLRCYSRELATSKKVMISTYKKRFIIQKVPIPTYDTV